MSAPPPPPGSQPPPGWQPAPPPPQPGWQPPPAGWQAPPPPAGYPGYAGVAGPPSGVHPDGRSKGLPPAVSLTVLGIGLLLAAMAAFFVIRSFVETLTDGEDIIVPGEYSVDLDGGGWRLYEEDESFTPGTGNELSSVTITGPDGDVDLRPQPFGTTETLSFDGEDYVAIGRFDIDEAGDYQVVATGEPGNARLRIGRPITHLGGEWPWMVGGGLAGITIIVGIVLTIFSFRNRGRARRYAATLR